MWGWLREVAAIVEDSGGEKEGNARQTANVNVTVQVSNCRPAESAAVVGRCRARRVRTRAAR